jgi:peptide/nickel transport system permease protein
VVISRLYEVMICFPTFFLILTIMAFLPPSIYNVMVVIGITGWTGVARLVRGEFLRLRNQDFVLASRTIGATDMRVILRHVLPNALAPVLVSATFGISGAILVESSLSFLGFGVPPPTPSWGDILSQARAYIDFAWWLTLFPGLAIFITVTAYNLVGEGLRDAIDPRLRS